jgi:hypothetical protein
MLKKDVFYGKIIESLPTTQPLKMLPGFQGPIPGIVILTASPIFHATFDSYFLKIGCEGLEVIRQEGFQDAGFCEIKVCPVCCAVFGRW